MTIKIPEFREELQGRPKIIPAIDTSTGQGVGTTANYLTATKLAQMVICYEDNIVCHNDSIVLKS